MKKPVKYILLGLFVLSFIIVTTSLIWTYAGSAPSICATLSKIFFVLWLVCFFLLQFYMESKNTRVCHNESSTTKERAYRELCCAAVAVNRCYHLMLDAGEERRAEQEVAYQKARQAFHYKAEMYDAIFQTRTVLIEGTDEEENILEITFESKPT